MVNILSTLMAVLVCLGLLLFIGMQVTKIFWAWKSKGESLRPRGIEDKNEKGGDKEG